MGPLALLLIIASEKEKRERCREGGEKGLGGDTARGF